MPEILNFQAPLLAKTCTDLPRGSVTTRSPEGARAMRLADFISLWVSSCSSVAFGFGKLERPLSGPWAARARSAVGSS